MITKIINKIFQGQPPHMVGDGFRVSNYIPGPLSPEQTSPFYLLDYNAPYNFKPSSHRKGVGAHPHRGFETVTLVFEGAIQHRDSSGGGGIIGPGEVQWMTAASGVLHDEFQTDAFSANGGTQHMLQLWVNLPAKNKMSTPHYQALTKDMIPVCRLDEQGSTVRVIAGTFKGIKGAADTYSPIEVYDVKLQKDTTASFELPATYNTMILIMTGNVTVNGKKAGSNDFVWFGNKGEEISIKAEENSSLVVLSGEPINEPVVAYGPFVMNTREEIAQAIEDFNTGKFGKL